MQMTKATRFLSPVITLSRQMMWAYSTTMTNAWVIFTTTKNSSTTNPLTVSHKLFRLIILYNILFINRLIKRHKVVTLEAPFLPRDGRNHFRYSLHLHTERCPGWMAWINTGMADPPKVVTNPSTGRARCSITYLMWLMPFPLRQPTHMKMTQIWLIPFNIILCYHLCIQLLRNIIKT